MKKSKEETKDEQTQVPEDAGSVATTGKTYGVTDNENAVESKKPSETAETMEYNGATNSEELSDEDKEKLEKELSRDGIEARVITASGKYLKVKYFRDGKPFSVYKGKSGSKEDAKKHLDEALENDAKVQS